jgi:HEAT repeat protein
MLWLHKRKLKVGDSAARLEAARRLGELGNSRAVAALAEALADRSWADRWAAAVALGKLRNGRGVGALGTALESDDAVDVRCNAAWALGRIGGKVAVEHLLSALDDQDESVRRVVVEALAAVGKGDTMGGLVKALGDSSHDVRLAAVVALGETGSGTAAQPLLVAIRDTEWSVRSAAAQAVAKICDSADLDALIGALGNEYLPARVAAADALGRIGDPRAIPSLEALLVAPSGTPAARDPRLRRSCAAALGGIGKAAAVASLLATTRDPFTAGVAINSLARVLRWDAGGVDSEDLQRIAALVEIEQIPWVIDDGEEEEADTSSVKAGRPWPVETSELRRLAETELRARGIEPTARND